ncbi:MAG TPA: GNAT family protein [Microbacterium sp.]|nr:GNAT family protein [Microbacterium sp.]
MSDLTSDARATALRELASLDGIRVKLVPLGPEHFEPLWTGLQDAESARLTGTTAQFDRETVLAHLERVRTASDRADWAILHADSGEYIGEVVLNELDDDHAAMNFRIALLADHLGQGLGTEATGLVLDHAFTALGLHRVSLEVYAFNPRAQRSYEKAGFIVEGRLRDVLRWDDEWVDAIVMSVLSTDPRPGVAGQR